MKTRMARMLMLLATAARGLSAAAPGQLIGFYHWAGQYPANAGEGALKIVSLGSRAVRLAISPRYEIDYHRSTACSPLTSLAELVQQPDIKAAFDNPGIDVIMLTAYDFTTFGDCHTQQFLRPDFYSPENVRALVQEYSDLTLYLYQAYAHTYKRFIVSNWESDNAIYCGQADSYATNASFRANCDWAYPSIYYGNATPAESLQALRLWFQYRQQGILDGRARAAALGLGGMRVYFAPEFCITRALHDNGLQSVLYDVIPSVMFDYVSYSAYESINSPTPGDTLTTDLNTIRDVTGSSSIILGEIGFARSVWGDSAMTRTDEVLAAAAAWGVSYIFVWNLYDTSTDDNFGANGTDGTQTILGQYYHNILAGTPNTACSVICPQ